jgi:glyoxylase I family protein
MPRGLPHHLDLTVTDLARSVAFYDKVLGGLGYARTCEYAGDVPCWVLRADSSCFSIGLHVARSTVAHDRHAEGFNHLALHAESSERVDAFHEFLQREHICVLDVPAKYDYTPGYDAVFFADPGGLKLELVHEPRS